MKETKVIQNYFKVNENYTKDQIKTIFENGSFMRGINICLKANAIVIIANHTKSLYDDEWSNGIFRYTGEGALGDQVLAAGNKAIEDAAFVHNRPIYLFEVFNNNREDKFVFKGEVSLTRPAYMSIQPDAKSKLRKVYQFDLKPFNPAAQYYEMSNNDKEKYISSRAKIINSRPNEDLINAAIWLEHSGFRNTKRQITTVVYDRDNRLSEAIKRMANGVCMLCKNDAPFIYNGKPYLESHHIVWLENGGEDKLSNLCALCPNCHRKVHRVSVDHHIKELLKYSHDSIVPIIKKYEEKFQEDVKKIDVKR